MNNVRLEIKIISKNDFMLNAEHANRDKYEKLLKEDLLLRIPKSTVEKYDSIKFSVVYE